MNKILKLCLALTAVLAAASCQRSTLEPDNPAGARGVELTARLESPSPTRVKLSPVEGGYKAVWSASDAITLVGNGEGKSVTTTFTLASGADTPVGVFTGDLAQAGEAPYYAVFPPDADACVADGTLHFIARQYIPAMKDNIAARTTPAVSDVTITDGAPSVALRNVFGLLAISVSSSTSVVVKMMAVHDLAGNMLWGDCRVPIVDGKLDYENVSLENGSNTIYMRWNGSVTFNNTPKTYYFPVPPGALDRGFSVTFYKQDLSQPDSLGNAYTFIQKVSDPVCSERSKVLQMENVGLVANEERHDVKGRGFYKSLFVDGGMYLTSNVKTSQLPAISYLGLGSDYEYFGSGSEAANQPYERGVMAASPNEAIPWSDANGALLYPDGEPRFRVFYSNGGTSYNHGPTLGDEGRSRIHDFYMNGGSYTGSCAGSFLGSTYVDKRNRYDSGDGKDFSYGIWPGNLNHTHLPINLDYPSIYTGMKILPAAKELGYYNSISTLDTIEDTRHHGGSYLPHDTYNKSLKAVELMSFQYANKSVARDTCQYRPENLGLKMYIYSGKPVDIVDSVSTWAYKKSNMSGRLVVTGSHPEGQSRGTQRDFMATIWRYAMDGVGDPDVKATLELGKPRTMDKTTEDNKPKYTRIGDRQYHHFMFVTDQDIPEFRVTLDSEYDAESGINLYLSLRKDDFAWLTDADYTLCNRGGKKELRIKKLPAGTWYIGVFGGTTVTATATSALPYYFQYSGKTEVLDGIPYTIGVSRGQIIFTGTTETRGGDSAASYRFDD